MMKIQSIDKNKRETEKNSVKLLEKPIAQSRY